jgi:hypothetical protein
MKDNWILLKEFCDIYGIHARTVRRWRKKWNMFSQFVKRDKRKIYINHNLDCKECMYSNRSHMRDYHYTKLTNEIGK